MQIIGKTSGGMDSLAKTSRLRLSLKSVFDFIKQQQQQQQQQQQEKRKEKKKNKQKKKKKNKNRPSVPSV